jgi:hypothetical protein
MESVKLGDKKLSFMCLCFCLCIFGCSGQVLQVAGFVVNALNTGLKLLQLFNGSDGPHRMDNSAIVKKLQERISASTETFKTSLGLSAKLGLIDDTVIDIHSSLADIINILEAKTPTERDEYSKLFVKRFEDNDLIKYIRFLPELLTYSIPGAQSKLIDLLADNTRCNMTALDAFRKFYVNLLSEGISIHLLYLHLSTKLPLNKTIAKWDASLEGIATIFDRKQASCMMKFPVLAQEDVNNAVDAVTLWSDNKQRYPWKTSDVMFLKPYGTFQFLYHKSRENHLFWQKTSTRNKIAVFNDINETLILPEVFVNVSETIKSSIEGEWDDNAAQHVGLAVEKLLNDQGLTINAIVVFFDGGDFSSEKIKIDESKYFCNIFQLTSLCFA